MKYYKNKILEKNKLKILTRRKKIKMNKKMIINGIKMLLEKNYKIDSHTIDLTAEVDSSLSFEENWRIIHDTFVKPKLIATFIY